MPLVLPYPTSPANGNPLDATPVLANIQAIAQAIQSFDGSQIQAGSIVASAFNANINPNTLLNETTAPFVRTGLVWSIVSGLNGTMTGGTMYINGIRVAVNSVPSNTFAVSKDTYIDIDVNGNITYQAVTNGAAAPALTANSIRVALVITSASAITTITQSGWDSSGVFIYNNEPSSIRMVGVGSLVPSGFVPGDSSVHDLSGSSKVFSVPSTSYLFATMSVQLQTNANHNTTLYFNVDGTNQPEIVFQGGAYVSSTTDVKTNARSYLVPLSAGNHTVKIQYSADAGGNCVLTNASWWGLLVRQ